MIRQFGFLLDEKLVNKIGEESNEKFEKAQTIDPLRYKTKHLKTEQFIQYSNSQFLLEKIKSKVKSFNQQKEEMNQYIQGIDSGLEKKDKGFKTG